MPESLGLALSCKCNLHFSKEGSVAVLSLWGAVTITHDIENSRLKSATGSSPMRTSVSKRVQCVN